MPDSGKIDREFFDAEIAPLLGADRDDVVLGPTHGVDFGMLDVGDSRIVVATDPLSILPALGFERAGRFAIGFVLADVAVSGVRPSHLSISFSLPTEMTDEEFKRLWGGIHEECRDLGISVVTGHTARYAECDYPWVGGATAFAVGDPNAVIRPDGARPGDDLLVTNGPAVEATGLLTTLFPDAIDLDRGALSTAQARLDDIDVVRDALAAADAGGVTAMHDATEGGLFGAFEEFAAAGDVRLEIDRDAIPIRPGVMETAEALDMDPWYAGSSGTLLLAVDPGRTADVLDALEARRTAVTIVGRVHEGSGVLIDGDQPLRADGDSSWSVYDRLANE
ncbi:MAG: AIR synthase family protein [Natronomonas sp.]